MRWNLICFVFRIDLNDSDVITNGPPKRFVTFIAVSRPWQSIISGLVSECVLSGTRSVIQLNSATRVRTSLLNCCARHPLHCVPRLFFKKYSLHSKLIYAGDRPLAFRRSVIINLLGRREKRVGQGLCASEHPHLRLHPPFQTPRKPFQPCVSPSRASYIP